MSPPFFSHLPPSCCKIESKMCAKKPDFRQFLKTKKTRLVDRVFSTVGRFLFRIPSSARESSYNFAVFMSWWKLSYLPPSCCKFESKIRDSVAFHWHERIQNRLVSLDFWSDFSNMIQRDRRFLSVRFSRGMNSIYQLIYSDKHEISPSLSSWSMNARHGSAHPIFQDFNDICVSKSRYSRCPDTAPLWAPVTNKLETGFARWWNPMNMLLLSRSILTVAWLVSLPQGVSEWFQRPIVEYWSRHDIVGIYHVSKGYKAAVCRSIRCWNHSGPFGWRITS